MRLCLLLQLQDAASGHNSSSEPHRLPARSLPLALVRAFGCHRIIFACTLNLIAALLGFAPIIILNDLVRFVEAGGSTADYASLAPPWVEVTGLAVFPAVGALLATRQTLIMTHLAVFVRTACSTLLYT